MNNYAGYSKFYSLLHVSIFYTNAHQESCLWITGVPRIRRLSDGAMEKSRATEAITQIVYSKEANRSEEMG